MDMYALCENQYNLRVLPPSVTMLAQRVACRPASVSPSVEDEGVTNILPVCPPEFEPWRGRTLMVTSRHRAARHAIMHRV